MDFLYKKHPKGTYEHIVFKRKVDIVVMIVMFALALGLYVIGRVSTGTNKNIMTIIAVLGLLPACKMVVDVIMCFRVKVCDSNIKNRIEGTETGKNGFYNMYFTSYDKNFAIDHMVITSNSIIGLSTDAKYDDKAFQTHISDLIRKEGLKDVFVKIFTDTDKYINRLSELDKSEDKRISEAICSLVMNVTF